MRPITIIAALASAVIAAPAQFADTSIFPLLDGFPTPTPAQLLQIQKLAGGSLPNSPLPSTLTKDEAATLKLLAHNEIYEVAFFSELLTNISTAVPGYGPDDTAPHNRTLLIKQIEAIKNQEELHAIAANAFLVSAKQQPIAPCRYVFPVSNFNNAILFAQVFTDLALATIPAVQLLFGRDRGNASRNVLTIGSILGQEGQQDGFFRATQGKTPSAAPFLTGSTASIAFNALRKLIVEDSCPQPLSTVGLPEWTSLNVLDADFAINNIDLNYQLISPEPSWPNWIVSNPITKNGSLSFLTSGLDFSSNLDRPGTFSLVYLSGQNKPVAVPVTDYDYFPPGWGQNWRAAFPFEKEGFSNGLVIVILAKGPGPFANADAVAAAANRGPILIEMN
ncbi:MAG: hypothetical protein Q9168_008269 [Polycauliona sp. 1 TL-2023]